MSIRDMSIAQMSVSGAVMILAIAAIRALAINRLPKRTFLALWGGALVRLLVPYALPSAFSVYSLLGRLFPGAKAAKTNLVGGGNPAVPISGAPAPNGAMAPPVPGAEAALSVAEPYVLVWLAGALACFLFFAAAYWRCRRELRESLPVDNSFALDWLGAHQLWRTVRLRQSDRISAPLTYGVFCPVILLPKRTDWSDETALAYVLTHELVHIRRFDAAVKLALAAALCVHWFNPAVWVMYVLANRDMELSCDEAVVRLFGEHTKSAYAMTLISLEEGRSGLRPLCNNFSQSAIQERIIAIMKTKKTTWLAVAAALALVAFVTTAFATTEQAAAESSGRRAAAGRVQLVTNDYTVTSYTDPADGQTYYSWDGGATWTAMTEREFNAASGWGEVEWWTAEEYAAWLEQERLELGSIVGSQGWTPSTGWFTWTQEMVDEALARYEQTLKDIRGGIKISKPLAEGDTLLQFGFEPDNQIAAADTRVVVGFEGKPANSFGGNMADDYKQQPAPELLAEYEAHGLTYEAAAKAFYFNGKPVRWFADFVELEEGAFATRYVYRNDVGTEYIHTVRRRIDNGDGSYDPFGQLTGIVPWEAGERDGFGFLFQGGQVGQVTAVFGSEDSAGTTFEELFARYKEFGITYVEAAGSSGRGNVYLNGRLVSRFADVSPRGDAFSFTSAQQGGIWVQTDYDGSGKLIGVQEMLPDAIAADKRAQEYVREEYRAEFRRVQEELSPYLAFGLDCQMDFDTGRLTMTWQGRPVHRFSDTKLGLFVADSLGGGGLGAEAVDLEAAYDGSGKLTGLATASARVTP